MSATLDDRRLSQLLPDAPVIRSAGAGRHGSAMAGYGCDPRLGAILYHAAATPIDATGSPAAPDDTLSAQEWLIVPGLLQLSQSPDARIRLALPLDIDRLAAARPAWFSSTTAMYWDQDKAACGSYSANGWGVWSCGNNRRPDRRTRRCPAGCCRL